MQISRSAFFEPKFLVWYIFIKKKHRNTVDWLHIKAPFSGPHLLCSLCSKHPINLKGQKTSDSMAVKLTEHSTYIFQRTVACEDS